LTTTHQPNEKLANGTYYWRVVPVDGGGHEALPARSGHLSVLTIQKIWHY